MYNAAHPSGEFARARPIGTGHVFQLPKNCLIVTVEVLCVDVERVRVVRHAPSVAIVVGPPCVHTHGGLVPPLVPWERNYV